MADVFAYLYGFGVGGDFTKSVIIVTAPTGSTVTCTKGTTVKTATEKNGEWWFKNLDIGTWTVTATLDDQTAVKTVTLEQLTVVYLTMRYGVLYENGESVVQFVNTATSNLGGYTNNANAGTNKGSVTFGDSSISLHCYEVSGGNNSAQFIGSSDKIDLSSYATLNVSFCELSVTPDDSGTGNYVCVAASPAKAFPGTGTGAAYKKTYSSSGANTISVDISSIDSAYIVITGRLYSSSRKINATITKIWLE